MTKKWKFRGQRSLKDTLSDVEAGKSERIKAEGSVKSCGLLVSRAAANRKLVRGARASTEGPNHSQLVPTAIFLPQSVLTAGFQHAWGRVDEMELNFQARYLTSVSQTRQYF